jgi:hypothetical protein
MLNHMHKVINILALLYNTHAGVKSIDYHFLKNIIMNRNSKSNEITQLNYSSI